MSFFITLLKLYSGIGTCAWEQGYSLIQTLSHSFWRTSSLFFWAIKMRAKMGVCSGFLPLILQRFWPCFFVILETKKKIVCVHLWLEQGFAVVFLSLLKWHFLISYRGGMWVCPVKKEDNLLLNRAKLLKRFETFVGRITCFSFKFCFCAILWKRYCGWEWDTAQCQIRRQSEIDWPPLLPVTDEGTLSQRCHKLELMCTPHIWVYLFTKQRVITSEPDFHQKAFRQTCCKKQFPTLENKMCAVGVNTPGKLRRSRKTFHCVAYGFVWRFLVCVLCSMLQLHAVLGVHLTGKYLHPLSDYVSVSEAPRCPYLWIRVCERKPRQSQRGLWSALGCHPLRWQRKVRLPHGCPPTSRECKLGTDARPPRVPQKVLGFAGNISSLFLTSTWVSSSTVEKKERDAFKSQRSFSVLHAAGHTAFLITS